MIQRISYRSDWTGPATGVYLYKIMITIKEQIKRDIRNSTYTYYKNTDLNFRDYIYGDKYYVTLADVIYRYLTTNNSDWDWEYTMLGNIDIDLLVNNLYLHYIRADKMFSNNYAGKDERHRKNYIMKALRNATEPLLVKQLKDNEVVAQELTELNNFKNLHYISIYSQEGGLLEDLSYKIWEKEKSKNDETEDQINQLAKIFKYLNPLERKVIYLVIKNKTYSQIAGYLQIDQDRIRKIIYIATEKLKARHSLKRYCA